MTERKDSYIDLTREIIAIKRKLVEDVKKNGLYENFGQKEVRRLRDKYTDPSRYDEGMRYRRALIIAFNNWCINYTQVYY